jgi:hypothetical protein
MLLIFISNLLFLSDGSLTASAFAGVSFGDVILEASHRQNDTELCVPLIMRAQASAAFSSGYVSIIGRTPLRSAKFSVSSVSAGDPLAQP